MTYTTVQRSFAGGIVTTAAQGRQDLAKYQTGINQGDNVVITKQSALEYIPGTVYLPGVLPSPNRPVRYLRYDRDVDNKYLFILNGGFLTILRDGTQVAQITHPWDDTQILTVDMDYSIVEGEYVSFWAHPDTELRELLWTDDATWTFSVFSLRTVADAEFSLNLSGLTPGTFNLGYQVTAIGANGEEDLPVIVDFGTPSTEPSTANPVTITVIPIPISTPNPLVSGYNIYRQVDGGVQGLIGFVPFDNIGGGSVQLIDTGQESDRSRFPPEETGIITTAGQYPGYVTFYQQRLSLSGFASDGALIAVSRAGSVRNFFRDRPLTDASSFNFPIYSRRGQPVRDLFDNRRMLAFTDEGVFYVGPQGVQPFTFQTVSINKASYYTVGKAEPEPVANDIIFATGRGSEIRSANYSEGTDNVQAWDLTQYIPDLLIGREVKKIVYQQHPNSLVYVLFTDGTMLILTYIPEQQVWGWTSYAETDTIDEIESIPEGNEDILYLCVLRNGNRVFERMREFGETEIVPDAGGIPNGVWTRSSVAWNGWLYNSNTLVNEASAPITLSGTTATCSVGVFNAGNEQQMVRLTAEYQLLIVTYISPTEVEVQPLQDIPDGSYSEWYLMSDTITGLSHLDGYTVIGNGDGFYTGEAVVSGGSAQFDEEYGFIVAGVQYQATIQDLDLESVSGETIFDKSRRVNRVNVHVQGTRDLRVEIDGNSILDRSMDQDYSDTPLSQTGAIDVDVAPDYESRGQVTIIHDRPFPMRLLSLRKVVETGEY